VADELKCAAGKPVPTGPGMTQVRFDANSMATVDGVRLSAQQPGAPDSMPHLLDLDGDGHRRLLVALSCGGEGDKLGTPNLLLLEHFGGAYRAIDAVDLPEELRKGDGYYQWTVAGRELTVTYVDTNTKYVWNGEQFQRSGQ